MTSKRGSMVTYLMGLLTIKSFSTLTTWYLITRSVDKRKPIISPLPECLWATKLSRMITYLDGLLIINHLIL